MNRGIARRTLFETERDCRYFLSRVARSVRRRELEVHAFCLLTTHFHMLVRSPRGALAEAMQRIQNEYVRWFNRARRRDGTLYRGRFCSRRVTTLAYQRVLVRYIDSNPVSAGLVVDPRLHPHGSARWYARARGPIWLSREWVEGSVCAAGNTDSYRTEDYGRVFGADVSPQLERLVERRLAHGAAADMDDPLDDLLEAATERVISWMRRKAALADGTEIGLPVCDGDDVQELVARVRDPHVEWRVHTSQKETDAWPQVQVGLLRDLCGATFAEAGTRVGVTEGGAWKLYRRHQVCVAENEDYASRVAVLAQELLARWKGPATRNR